MITTEGDKMTEIKLHRRDSLINTAIDILDELGIQGLSTREIAKREGISEATLFRHYKNKNELLVAVLDYFSKFDKDLFDSVKLMNLNSYAAIRFYIGSSVEYYENYPALISIMQLLYALRYEKNLTDKVNEILYNRYNFIKDLINKGKDKGEISDSSQSDELTDLICGVVLELSLRWRCSGCSFSLKEQTIATLDLVFKVYLKK